MRSGPMDGLIGGSVQLSYGCVDAIFTAKSMAKQEKLRTRLFSKPYPKDVRFQEIVTVMRGFGFTHHEQSGGSSHCYFVRTDRDGEEQRIDSSRPHPSGIMKTYQIKEIHDWLVQWGLL